MVVTLASPEVIRYSRIQQKIVGKVEKMETVQRKSDCTLNAFNAHRIAYNIAKTGTKLTCSILTEIEEFEKQSEEDVEFYLLDRRPKEEDQGCSNDLADLNSMLSGNCPLKSGCKQMTYLAQYCESTDPDCVAENGQTLKEFVCSKSPSECCTSPLKYDLTFKKCFGVFKLDKNAPNAMTQDGVNKQCPGNSIPATVKNQEQNDIIWQQTRGKGCVIGFQIPIGEKWSKTGFKWMDGSTSEYMNWESIDNILTDEIMAATVDFPLLPWKGKWGDIRADQAYDLVGHIACTLLPELNLDD
ncbi:hypothetical protein L596_028211 [Steinernema carpocapsae]|uniref:C-type lectin domain-containing protein n=1 Tax=Steinernema carpocapsae TaxID=34508 RepID=A0A4V5ZXT8_STECR|nr:hypothetical protein L596_028211 [Steinernema carpocapsae]